eukprot:3331782-Rhodomonas_salina.1
MLLQSVGFPLDKAAARLPWNKTVQPVNEPGPAAPGAAKKKPRGADTPAVFISALVHCPQPTHIPRLPSPLSRPAHHDPPLACMGDWGHVKGPLHAAPGRKSA